MIGRISLLVPGLCRGGMTRTYVIAGALRTIGIETEIVGMLAAGETVYPEPPPGLVVRPVPDGSFPRRVRAIRAAATGDALYAIKPRASSLGAALLIRRGRPVIVDVDDWEAAFRPRDVEGPWPRRTVRRARRSLRRHRWPGTPQKWPARYC